MLYAYNSERVIIFDLPRTYADNLDHIYTCIENFKNGQYLSTKYNSEMRFFETPHIIVFSNFRPDESMLSRDRYVIRNIETKNEGIQNLRYTNNHPLHTLNSQKHNSNYYQQ